MSDKRGIIPRKIKGFRDIDANLNALRHHIVEAASKVYKSYGFEHWDTPVLEYAEVLGKYMPDADTVEQGVYAFRNPESEAVLLEDGREMRDAEGRVIMENHVLALRYDLTAPLARLYAEGLWLDVKKKQVQEGNCPLFRRFQYGPVFRYEIKLMPGRFREFWQLDFDTVGSDDVATDAEACMLLSESLEAIGLKPETYLVKVNNRKILKGFLAGIGIVDEETEQGILRIIDKLDKVGWDSVVLELGPGRTDQSGAQVPGMGLPKQIVQQIVDFLQSTSAVGSRTDALTKLEAAMGEHPLAIEGLRELRKMHQIWEQLGFDESKIVFDPTLMRGMAYYTGPVFEVESLLTYRDEKGKERKVGSICGGGRYDDLVHRLLGMKVPATGASIGVDRLAEVLRMSMPELATAVGPVLIAYFDDELQTTYYQIASELRKAGIEAEVYSGFHKGFRKIKKQMSYADQKNCPAVVLLGGDEAAKGVVTVKNLRLGKALSSQVEDKVEWNRQVQKEVPRSELVAHLKTIL